MDVNRKTAEVISGALGREPRRRAFPLLLTLSLASKLLAVGLWVAGFDPRAGAVFFFSPDPLLLYALFVPSAQGLVQVVTRFTTTRPEVWLTIDDGPDPDDTPRILDLLEHHGARATFFVIGERAERWPELVREILRRGHAVAHHTQSHPALSFWCAGPRRLARELDRPLERLQLLGARPAQFRSPVGIKHLFLAPALADRGLRFIGWSVRSGDCHATGPDEVVQRVLPRLSPGAIVLLHEGPSVPMAVRVRGIAALLAALDAHGYRAVIPSESDLV